MPTQAAARKSVADEFLTKWGTRTVAIGLGNEKLKPPDTGDYVALFMLHDDSKQATHGPVGGRKFDRFGRVILQIFVDADDGEAVADAHVDFARTIFEGVTIGGVHMFNAVPREVGPDGDLYQMNLETSFEYTEKR